MRHIKPVFYITHIMHVRLHSPVADPKNLISAGVFEQGQVFEKIRSLSHNNVSKSPKANINLVNLVNW